MGIRSFYTHLSGILFLTCVALLLGAGAEDALAQLLLKDENVAR